MAAKPRIFIDFNKIYESNSCGPFKIIEDMGRNEKSRLFVKIKFIYTGFEKIVRYDIAMDGKVIDDLYGIDFNKIYTSVYYGPFKIISYVGRKDSKKIVRIKFLNTGYETETLLRLVLTGQVKDDTVSYSNRQFCTSKDKDQYNKYIRRILANRWQSMISRCYNIHDIKYNEYGALGVTVCDRWKKFENYIIDISEIPNFDKFYENPSLYHLDKDYLQFNLPKNKRIYSPSTCIFLSIIDNSNLSIIERHKQGEYYGIKITNNSNFKVTFSVDGKRLNFGIYNNIIAAANAYNHYYTNYAKYDLVPLINNVEYYMPFEETQKYLVTNRQV